MKRIMKREGSRGRVRGDRWDDPKISLRDMITFMHKTSYCFDIKGALGLADWWN